MIYTISDIEIDFTDEFGTCPGADQVIIIDEIKSQQWNAVDEDDLIDQITLVAGWDVQSVEYICTMDT